MPASLLPAPGNRLDSSAYEKGRLFAHAGATVVSSFIGQWVWSEVTSCSSGAPGPGFSMAITTSHSEAQGSPNATILPAHCSLWARSSSAAVARIVMFARRLWWRSGTYMAASIPCRKNPNPLLRVAVLHHFVQTRAARLPRGPSLARSLAQSSPGSAHRRGGDCAVGRRQAVPSCPGRRRLRCGHLFVRYS